MSIIGKTILMPRMHGLLVSVRFKSDGGEEVLVIVPCPQADIVDKVLTSLFQRGERRVTVELQGLSAEHSRYPNRPPDFSSMLPLPKLRIRVNSPHLPCGAEDSISSLALAPGKKELDVH